MSNFGQSGWAAQQAAQNTRSALHRARQNHEASNHLRSGGGGGVFAKIVGTILMVAVLAVVATVFTAVFAQM